MTNKEKEIAILVPADSFPEKMMCLICDRPWMGHQGMLCPNVEMTRRFGVYIPGDTLFVPDEKGFKDIETKEVFMRPRNVTL